MSDSLTTTLFVGAFPLIFIGLWLTITAVVLHFSGWARLEEYLPDRPELKPMRTFRFQGFYLGKGKLGASYRGCVTFEVCEPGLRVRVWKVFAPFSQPIFIPWEGMEIEAAKIFAFSATRLKIGPGGEYWMTLRTITARDIARVSGRIRVPE